MNTVLVLNGPNLNLLGSREPVVYGTKSLDEINQRLTAKAKKAGIGLIFFQSNSESDLIDRIHRAKADGIVFAIFNPAAFTHTSVALRDALAGVELPFIEVHLSNIHAREPFRAKSHFSDIAVGVISGLGAQSYELALDAAIARVLKP